MIIASKASGLGPQAFGGGRGPGTSAGGLQQYIMNVGLKVNHKLGGRNMQIRSLGADAMAEAGPPLWSSKPTMLVGIDVSHPQSADPNEPSIVGLVASIDRSFAQCVAVLDGVDRPLLLVCRDGMCARVHRLGRAGWHKPLPPICALEADDARWD